MAEKAHGHVVTTILIGMVAMLFTAISYGRMANAYPTAGSAYSYVGQELHSSLGYLTGWAMVFDYVLNPIISVIWCSKAAMNFPGVALPGLGHILCPVVHGSESAGDQSQRPHQSVDGGRLDRGGRAVPGRAVRYIWTLPDPSPGRFCALLQPGNFFLGGGLHGASLAMLTYIGFDAISTLSEEAHNPRRNILLATVLTCLITGILCGAQVYAAQLVWPSNEGFRDPDTAFVDVAGRAESLPISIGRYSGGASCFSVSTWRFWSHRPAPAPGPSGRGPVALWDGPGQRHSQPLLRRRSPRGPVSPETTSCWSAAWRWPARLP